MNAPIRARCRVSGLPLSSARRMLSGLVAGMILLPVTALAGPLPNVAFYYGQHPPVDVLRAFDWIVVQPYAKFDPRSYDGPHSQAFAYVSLGEVHNNSPLLQEIPKECLAGRNPVWKSQVVNQTLQTCRNFYLDHVFAPLWQRGFRGFFLDTLDSYRIVATTKTARARYRTGLVALIRAVKQRYPTARLILNRGFSLLDRIKGDVAAVAAESLFDAWSEKRHAYEAVPPATRKNLLRELQRVQRLGLPTIVIDYLPPGQRAAARRDAGRIAKLGFVPYVTNATLNIVGTGRIEVLPRKLLLLHAGGDAMNNNLNWYAAMPLNHLGYATHILDVAHTALPAGPQTGKIAGIVTWFDTNRIPHANRLYRWLRTQMQAGVPVVMLGEFGFAPDAMHLAPLGLALGRQPHEPVKAQVSQSARGMIGFETPALPTVNGFVPLRLEHGRSLLQITAGRQSETAAAITPWGGYALDPYVLRQLPQGTAAKGELQAAWILNPFAFFKAALRLPDQPVPDTTTANGRRLLMAQIDGDGFDNGSWLARYRGKPAALVVLKQILEPYRIPVAASVIASEFAPHGLFPAAKIAALQPIARAIFRLPWVEIASHTYSHPFDWPALEKNPGLSAGLHLAPNASGTVDGTIRYAKGKHQKYGYNLPVPGYRFSPQMEVTGSIDIINRLLAPPGKKVRIIQWSGDTNPDAQVLALAYRDGVMNINGGASTISRNHPSLTNVASLGLWKGDYFQVYAPDANEDVYTHNWQPPYCGFAHVIQTFELSGAPRRLEPIDIYYHFYSGARSCALAQLKKVYRWALAQPTTPVFPSTYSRIALGSEHATIARYGAGYRIRGYGKDQELRLPLRAGYPDLGASRNIVGYRDHGPVRYIHLGPGGTAYLVLQSAPPTAPYLRDANGLVEGFTRTSDGFALRIDAQAPLQLTFGNVRVGCILHNGGKNVTSKVENGFMQYRTAAHRTQLQLRCPPWEKAQH